MTLSAAELRRQRQISIDVYRFLPRAACSKPATRRYGRRDRRTDGAGFTPSGDPAQKKMWGPLIYEYPVTPDCVHPTLSGLTRTRTVVIIDILLRTRAAMHTTVAAAADWQFEASLSEANCKRVSFCGGALFMGAPVRPNMLNMPKSASADGRTV